MDEEELELRLADVVQELCEHDWVPTIVAAGGGLAIAEECDLCGAVAYEPSVSDE